MTEREKEIGDRVLKALDTMSEHKRECLLYFAEGVAAASESKQEG